MDTTAVQVEIDTPSEDRGVPTSASLTSRTTVRQLVAVFQRAEADVRKAFALLSAAESSLNEAFTLGGDFPFHVETRACHHRPDFDDPDHAVKVLRRKAWETIVERLEIKRAMSMEAARKLDKHLEESEPEEITEQTVHAFVLRFAQSMPEMFEAAVREVFNWLRPAGDCYRAREWKTNARNVIDLGARHVLPHMVWPSYSSDGTFRVSEGGYGGQPSPSEHLTALWNVFSMLDGQGIGPKTSRSPIENAIMTTRGQRAIVPHPSGDERLAYFELRWHLKGTLHIHIRRADLLAKLNQIAGGMNLRPAA